jgi:proteasome lid subunit RPN8/RPN11
MLNKVRVSKGALDYFRKKARDASPLEIQAYFLGNIKSVNEVEITDFIYTTEYATQTKDTVGWNADHFHALKERAVKEGKIIIGDIHSHPNYLPVMSGTDYRGAILDSLLICGICSIYGRKTNVLFWTPNSSLHCEVKYV